ncbi:DNA helicase MCM8-like [Athalia rosae]|uniref:DNA helicase MCM8-like n=1 Tax=Athalia rosae TaxID=37344 RepID=UPI002033E03E|nr:DNA helicase MCM8-like [Athalia rosae]XP_048510846.1 DNA helicase MCM8-like [Athalia rosae]XP_048510847.1 DNA helicase MCM8-like [Athalia rosae]
MSYRGRNWYRGKGKRKRTSDVEAHTSGGTSSASKKKTPSSSSNPSRNNPTFYKNKHSPYNDWDMYFNDEEYRKGFLTEKKIQTMERYVTSHPELFPLLQLKQNKAYNVDLKTLYKDDLFLSQWQTFKEDLTNNPRHTLNCLGIAINQTMIDMCKEIEGVSDADVSANLPKAVARVFNHGPVLPLRDLKMNTYGKLISIRGCIMRVGGIKHIAQWIEFSCMSCALGNVVVRQVDGIYTTPTKCIACNNGRKFRPVLGSLRTKTMTFQVIKLQEHFGDELDDKGRTPRDIEIELLADLVHTCMPGDDITVTGIIKVRGTEKNSSKGDSTSNLFSLYMEAVYILNNKYQSQNKRAADLEMTATDYEAIQEVYRDPNTLKLLVHSLCPSIYGHEYLKMGLILSLFGGTPKSGSLRDDIHVLLVGDPGLGKSQLLQACARVASKGVYVCGTSSTSTGLTVTLAKDKSTGECVLEPGALVLADKGCCCIDEFDKMSTQHQALLEAMEQQSVSLAKSGMICCLPARTSILAAANPADGRYKKSKTILENLNMNQPLLSRFDLIFILVDQPNEQMDDMLSEHVMAVHAGKSSHLSGARGRDIHSSDQSLLTVNTLRENLHLHPSEGIDLLPHQLLRKYILYAKEYVKPRITPAAAEILQNFYLERRARNDKEKVTPMTPRQLEALIRLTEARAKLELREEATHADAVEVLEIVEYSMADVAIKDIVLDRSILSSSGKITAKKVKAFVDILANEASSKGEPVFTITEMKMLARRESVVIDDFSALISKLNENGVILKKGPHMYSYVGNK